MEIQTKPPAIVSPVEEGLDDFRVSSVREIALILKQFCDGSEPVSICTQAGSVLKSALWSLDAERNTIGFNADPADPVLQEVLDREEAVVVGHLASVKVQFEVSGLKLLHGNGASLLSCSFPSELFRFQRRDAFRVRPAPPAVSAANLSHPHFKGALKMRIIDVSITGCALFLPDTVEAPPIGTQFQRVQIELDSDAQFQVNLRLAHVSALTVSPPGSRLGLEFVCASGDVLRALQRFIDKTQKRNKLMALN